MMSAQRSRFDPLGSPVPLSRRLPLPAKVLCILLIIALPLLLVWIILPPLAARRNSKPIVYTLRNNFSRSDLNRLVQQMKCDPEYQFYFRVLGEQSLSESVAQAYGYLELARDKAGMRQVIDRLKSRIEGAADQILALSVPEDFSSAPIRYDKLCRSLSEFVRAEFVLNLAGVCYKLLYDDAFFFTWSAEAPRAAYRVQTIFSALNDQQRQEIERLLFEPKPVGRPQRP